MLWLLGLVCLAGPTLSYSVANTYVDDILETLFQQEVKYAALDPSSMPDFTSDFKDKVFGITVKGTASYRDGEITNLSKLKRANDCKGPDVIFGKLTVNCTLNFSELQFVYHASLKYGKVPKVDIKAKASAEKASVFVEISGDSFGNNPQVTKLNAQLGILDTKLSGLGPLNKFLSVLEKAYISSVTADWYNLLNSRFKEALNRAFSAKPMPRN